MSRPSLRTSFIAVAVALVGLHLVSVTLAALPPNRYSDAVRDQTSYLDPYFNQNWRLFAPNPISEDRNLRFQGAYTAANGEPDTTAWLDWTDVELDLVRHRLVGGRAGYVTSKLVTPLKARTSALSTVQRRVATDTSPSAPPSFDELAAGLDATPASAEAVAGYLRYEKAVTRLATDALEARWPGLELTAVRYSIRSHGVAPFAARTATAVDRAASRPAPVDEPGGWRRPAPGGTAARESMRDFERRHG